MSGGRVLYHLARADFLQRVRSYGFLVTLGFTVYFCYICLPPNHASYVTLQMGGHRGIYNSAYVGTIVAMETTLILSLAGFYLVKNAVDRDIRTGVGQILAATPLTKLLYATGKALSNFAVLASMAGVIAAAAAAMQFARHEDTTILIWPLVAPLLFIVLPVMAAVAGAAVLFEVVPMLRGGLGNVVYFFLWIMASTVAALPAETGAALRGVDLLAFSVVTPSLRSVCDAAFPGCANSPDFSLGFTFADHWGLTTFRWTGVHWSGGILASRLVWVGLAAGFVFLAGALFRRFDPAWERTGKPKVPASGPPESAETAVHSASMHPTLSRLAPADRRFRFAAMVKAELRIALKGVNSWWYAVALMLIAGEVASPPPVSRGFLVAAWIWPILVWSGLGTREAREGTRQLVFSTPHPLRRQLPACWLAGVGVAIAMGAGAALRLLIAGNITALGAWLTGAFFIPTLALALGVWSGSSKLFEVVYMILWYAGPANQLAVLDFTGASGGASHIFLACTAVLAACSLVGRKRQIRQ